MLTEIFMRWIEFLARLTDEPTKRRFVPVLTRQAFAVSKRAAHAGDRHSHQGTIPGQYGR